MHLASFLEAQLISFMLVFARLGSAMIFMPGIGEQAVPVRFRLLFAVAVSAGLMPVTPVYGIEPIGPIVLLRLLAFEVTIGLWIGLTARILLSALQFAGYQIGLVAGIFVLGQVTEGNFLTPKLVGNSVGLHPVWLLLALSVFGALFGFVGMLVAVPIAAALGVLARFATSQYLTGRLYTGQTEQDQGTD